MMAELNSDVFLLAISKVTSNSTAHLLASHSSTIFLYQTY